MKTVVRGMFGIALAVITVAVFISSSMIVAADAGELNVSSYTMHGTIRINSDTELETLIATNLWNGSGTADEPYIIENLRIDAAGESNGIFIGNTTAFLVIRDCDVSGTVYDDIQYMSGGAITAYNATNIVIENNNCHDCRSGSGDGIDVLESNLITINNNTCSNVWWGITLIGSCNVTVTNNSCNGNVMGVYLYSSSNNNTISDNNCSGNFCGISLEWYSDHNIVSNNDFSGGNYSIYSYFSGNNSIMKNDCSGCLDFAIYLNNTYDTKVEKNDIIDGDGYGLYLASSDQNRIYENTIRNMTEYGIYLDNSSDDNEFTFNYLLNNHGASSEYNSSHVQAYDAGTNNWFFSTNYWSDWRAPDVDLDGIVDVPYVIDGGDSVDGRPLSLLVEIMRPSEQLNVFSDDVHVTWFPKMNVMAIAYYEVSIDGVNWITVNKTDGIVHTFSDLDDGEYTAYVRAYDALGNFGETSANFTVASGDDGYIILYVAIVVVIVAIVVSMIYLKRKE